MIEFDPDLDPQEIYKQLAPLLDKKQSVFLCVGLLTIIARQFNTTPHDICEVMFKGLPPEDQWKDLYVPFFKSIESES